MTITDAPPSQITTHPVALIWPAGEDIADIEATDAVVISSTLESVDVGGGGLLHGCYLRITGPDLIVAADELRRLADRISAAVFEARDAAADAERHDCYCGVRLEADELTCGAMRCNREAAMDGAL